MRKKLIWLPLVFLFAATWASAEGFYAGAGIGLTQIEDSDQGESFDDSPFGWKILAGYDFTDNFAVEGGYLNSGKAEDTVFGENVEVELTAFVISAVGLMPVSDTVQLFGKLGFYSGEQEVTAFGVTVDDDDDGLTVGAGLRFRASENFVIRGDFDWFDTDLDTLWSIGAGFQFYFGN